MFNAYGGYNDEESFLLGSLDDLTRETMNDGAPLVDHPGQLPLPVVGTNIFHDEYQEYAPVDSPHPTAIDYCNLSMQDFTSPRFNTDFPPLNKAWSTFSPSVKPSPKPRRRVNHALQFQQDMYENPLMLSNAQVAGQIKRKRNSSCSRPEDPSQSKVRKSGDAPQNGGRRQLTSKYRGVCWYKRTQRWVVQVKVKGVRMHIGYYMDEKEAAASYERAIAKIMANPDIDRNELRDKPPSQKNKTLITK